LGLPDPATPEPDGADAVGATCEPHATTTATTASAMSSRSGRREEPGSGIAEMVAGRSDDGRRDQGRLRTIPPSTGTITPVRYDAAGESRNAATRPSSSGSP
jgi:hypothetical protein